jgi:hypothetical protein
MAGKIVADTLEHSTAGSITTNYVVEGSAKAWIHFDAHGDAAVSGTPISRDSLNVSSIGDNGNGDYTVNFGSNFANGFYASSGTGDHGQYMFCVDPSIDPTSSAFAMRFSYPPSATSDIDVDNVSTIHMGELA